MREYVRDRLRLALDFATLGAYELSERELAGERDARGQAPDARGTKPGEASSGQAVQHACREVRGASRPARAHAEVATGAVCTCVESDESAHRCSALEYGNEARLSRGGTRLAGHRRSRGGEVTPRQQPCIWTGG